MLIWHFCNPGKVSVLKADILFVTHKYPPSTGGMQKQSYELITNVAKLRAVKRILFKGNYPKIFFFLSVSVRAFIYVLTNKHIKLVHANDGLMALFLTPLLAIKRVRLCATIHGLDVVFNVGAYQWWVRRFLSKFSFLIAVSEATKHACVERGVNAQKVFYIPNAVELPEKVDRDPTYLDWVRKTYAIDLQDSLIISSVGRPVPRKGFGWFAKEVLPNLPKTKYVVVGTKIDSSWLISVLRSILPEKLFEKICIMLGVPLDNIRLAEIAKTNKNLVLLGKIPSDKLTQTYLNSDIFVMPNRHVKGDFEGFGLVALEAGSLGAVCLAANVDGIPSAIKHGENGYLLESLNKAAWIQKIEELNEKHALKEAKDHFRPYFEMKQTSWEMMSKAYLQLFDEQLKT